jgi:hypothetical protein
MNRALAGKQWKLRRPTPSSVESKGYGFVGPSGECGIGCRAKKKGSPKAPKAPEEERRTAVPPAL